MKKIKKISLWLFLWYAFGIPDAVKLCVLREQVLFSPSPSHHQSHDEIEKALFKGEKEAFGLNKQTRIYCTYPKSMREDITYPQHTRGYNYAFP